MIKKINDQFETYLEQACFWTIIILVGLMVVGNIVRF